MAVRNSLWTRPQVVLVSEGIGINLSLIRRSKKILKQSTKQTGKRTKYVAKIGVNISPKTCLKDAVNNRLYERNNMQFKRAKADCYCGEDIDSRAQA